MHPIQLGVAPEDLYGLRSLTDVRGDLEIGVHGPNLNLRSLHGLESLRFIGGDLEITGNVSLEDINGLRSLNHLNGDLVIVENSLLERTDEAFEELTIVGGSVRIEGNPRLPSLELLRSVRFINNELLLRNLHDIGNLEGLGNLRYVGIGIEVFDTGLTTLAGLSDQLTIGPPYDELNATYLSVVENPSLPTCEVDALVERLRAEGWTGEVEVRGNNDEITCE